MKFSHFAKKDLEDQFLLCGSGVVFLFVLPFSIFRLTSGDTLIGIIDLMVSLTSVFIFLQIWWLKTTNRLNTLIVIFTMFSILSVIYLKGSEVIYWTYPAIVVTYFLLKSHIALVFNSFFVIAVVGIASLFQGFPPIGVYPSILLVAIVGFIYSLRSERQNYSLKQLASVDVLTRVKNRRSFDEKIEEILAENQRDPKSICLLILDLDLFKEVNDSHGHKQGDKVLIDFAQTVKTALRSTDYVYRFGGEEFVIIANNSSLQSTGIFAEAIRQRVQNKKSLAKFSVTVSIGISEIKSNDDADSWFRRADLALYKSKSDGRNKVYLAEFDNNGVINFKKVQSKTNIKVDLLPVRNQKQDKNLGGYSSFLYDRSINMNSRNL